VVAEVTGIMQPGHISLPNGQGLEYRSADGRVVKAGAAPNELTDVAARDFLAGTPWHKHVPARLERCAAPVAETA
jgi:anaerobic selenocysteine-containing dehydrogenase